MQRPTGKHPAGSCRAWLVRLAICLLLLVTAGPVAAQDDPWILDHTYDLLYPKRAKGNQPVPFDVGEIDNINLSNGNLTMSIPLGTPLVAGGDLSWQPVLYYNSKIWSRDKRDTEHDYDASGMTCMFDEGKGYLTGDKYIGVGWTLKLPHIHLRRVQYYSGVPYDDDAHYFIDSVITADGARHQLRTCLDSWGCETDPDPNIWYSADGSGWRVTLYRGPDNDTWDDDYLVGENNGLRYIFNYPVLLNPTHGQDDSLSALVDTDFKSEARGWYCTRIESVRWSQGNEGAAFPAITATYRPVTGYAPKPLEIAAYYYDGQKAGSVLFTYDPSGPDRWMAFRDSNDDAYLAYAFDRSALTRFDILDFPDVDSDSCASTRTGPVYLLESLTRYDPTDPDPDNTEDETSWFFEYERHDCVYVSPLPVADPQGGCIWETEEEKKGTLSSVTLPNETRIEYKIGLWTFSHQELLAGCPLLAFDYFGSSKGQTGSMVTKEEDPPVTRILSGDSTVGVRDRKVLEPDNHLLEWTEYFRTYPGYHQSDLIDFFTNRYGIPFSFNNRVTDPTKTDDFDPTASDESDDDLLAMLATDSDLLYVGQNQTVLRRHLIVDDSPPPGSGDDLNALLQDGYLVDVPSARFDDTIHIFSNGRFVFDTDDNGCIGRRDGRCVAEQGWLPKDHFGQLPLDGRVLETRYYRGSALNSNGSFWWWTSTAPRPERIEFFTYTLDWEDQIPHGSGTPGTPLTLGNSQSYHDCLSGSALPLPYFPSQLGDLAPYCGGRAENVRLRSKSTVYPTLDGSGTEYSVYTGSESYYETDLNIPGDPSVGSYVFPWNTVLTRSTSLFFTTTTPDMPVFPGAWNLLSHTAYDESSVSELWLTSQPSQQSAEMTGTTATGFSTSASFSYTNGLLTAMTRHGSSASEDVVTSYTYWGPWFVGLNESNHGRLRTVSLSKNGQTDDITGYLYSYQIASSKWKLCPVSQRSRTAAPGGPGGTYQLCEGWATNNDFSALAEKVVEQVIDSTWRRPTAVMDANGDGISLIEYDFLGRMTHIVPTHILPVESRKAESWLSYPDLRTSEVAVELADLSGDPGQIVAHHDFDGLGRLSHAARRLEGPTNEDDYSDPEDFRHKTFFYDGSGHVWAESHWLGSAAAAPGFLANNSNFELVTQVDAFGRRLKTLASDGGIGLNAYLGQAYSLSVVAQLMNGIHPITGQENATWLEPLARTITRSDARGNAIAVYEDEAPPAVVVSPLAFPDVDDPSTFTTCIGSTYTYDVANRLRTATVNSSQTRSWEYDELGNLIAETYPELGVGQRHCLGGHDARSLPRLSLYGEGASCSSGTLVYSTAMETYYDAAGRPLETWTELDDNAFGASWYRYSTVSYGTNSTLNEVGKPIQTTQYNILDPLPAACTVGCVADGNIMVSHTFTYGDGQGLLSERTTTISTGQPPAVDSQSFTQTYTYDLWGNLKTLGYPSINGLSGDCDLAPAPSLSFTWDTVSLQGISTADQTDLLTVNAYDTATGIMTSWSTAAGGPSPGMVDHTVSVDGTRSRPSSITAKLGGSTVFASGTYAYDVLGNFTDIGSSWHYEYDALSRLTVATRNPTGSSASRLYTYDRFGNMSSIQYEDLSVWNLPVDAATNRLSASSGYLYDDRGNLITEPVGDPASSGWNRQLRFDTNNHVMAAWATTPSGEPPPTIQDTFAFAYDGAGERVLRYRILDDAIADAQLYLRDEAGNVLTELLWVPTGDGTEGHWTRIKDYVYLGNKALLRIEQSGNHDLGYEASYSTFIHDHLGSTRGEVTAAGASQPIDYWPFGEFVFTPGLLETHMFTGHEREFVGASSNVSPLESMDYMHARYYSPKLGRFLSVDPVGGRPESTLSWNMYAYVLGNPLKLVDPSGEAEKEPVSYGLMGGLKIKLGKLVSLKLQVGLTADSGGDVGLIVNTDLSGKLTKSAFKIKDWIPFSVGASDGTATIDVATYTGSVFKKDGEAKKLSSAYAKGHMNLGVLKASWDSDASETSRPDSVSLGNVEEYGASGSVGVTGSFTYQSAMIVLEAAVHESLRQIHALIDQQGPIPIPTPGYR